MMIPASIGLALWHDHLVHRPCRCCIIAIAAFEFASSARSHCGTQSVPAHPPAAWR